MAFCDAHKIDRRRLHIPGSFRCADHNGGAAIAFQAAVEQPQRVRDHAGRLMILDCHRLGHHRVAVEDCVVSRRYGNLAELLAGGAVLLHVAPRHWSVELSRCDSPQRHFKLANDFELRHLLHA